MTREEIDELLNPDDDSELKFVITSAIQHIQNKTHREFLDDNGELDMPADLVAGIRVLVNSTQQDSDVQSESVGGELSVTYFDGNFGEKAKSAASHYWRPYRRLNWDGSYY